MRIGIDSFLPVALLAFIAGCGGAPPPDREMVAAEAAIRGAKEIGAPSIPDASLHLRLAERQVDKAKALIRDGNNNRALMMLMRAQADAELAVALAREQTLQTEAKEAEEMVRELEEKMKAIGR